MPTSTCALPVRLLKTIAHHSIPSPFHLQNFKQTHKLLRRKKVPEPELASLRLHVTSNSVNSVDKSNAIRPRSRDPLYFQPDQRDKSQTIAIPLIFALTILSRISLLNGSSVSHLASL
ncbi:hypothetical protein RvY_14972 [Ramazzottius varieornatus]|uniref:Uncharacterized protein n=1 Tax=Ramazzottius varieornatus TaxID=947166 RepID=A0A1D1W1I1_RAMVA|nr:hypothetical protein RvY_14972 [Ramazzottius varieornatus]